MQQRTSYLSGFICSLLFMAACDKNEESEGCTSPQAVNYNYAATVDDGSCVFDTIEYDTTTYNPSPANFDVDISTTWSEDWDDWDISINGVQGNFSTTWSDNWNDWTFSLGGVSGDISTTWSNNWNDWDVTASGYSLDISTTWNNNWNDWDITDNNSSWDVDVSSTWNDNWNDWDVNGDSVNVDLSTTWSNDWDDWDGSGNFGTTLPAACKMAVLFVPVMISVLKQEGIIP